MIDEKQLFICHICVGDEFLKTEILKQGNQGECTYCQKSSKVVQLPWLADNINSAIEEHFYLTSNEPTPLEYAMLSDKESDYEWERHGEPVNYVIQEIAEIDEAVANDVQTYLSFYFDGDPAEFEEDPYGDEACYTEKPPESYVFQESWDYFCQEIRGRARFFSQSTEKVLGELFSDLDSLRTFEGNSVIRGAGPSTENATIFRARVCLSHNALDFILKNPVQELGAPPSKLAKSGRMNAAGISVFYGAADAETCIAEIRPPVGSHVVVGSFQIIQNIRLLDLDLLSQVYVKGSCFDPEFRNRTGHAAFLKHLVEELINPVMPGDEIFEYLPTQVVAEYLAERVRPRIDGIIFKSSQIEGEGKNIILFYNSCKVEQPKIPLGTTVSVDYGWSAPDDYDDSITVFEELPGDDLPKTAADTEEHDEDHYGNDRETTLNLDVTSDIDVRVIMGASYKTHKRYISRYRHEKMSSKAEPFF